MLNFGLVLFFCVSQDSPPWSVLSETSHPMFSDAFSFNPGFQKQIGTLMTFPIFKNLSRFSTLPTGNRMLCIYFKL